MSSDQTPSTPDRSEQQPGPAEDTRPDGIDPAEPVGHADPADPAGPAEPEQPGTRTLEDEGTVLYVRRGRSLGLGGWVVIALVVTAIAGCVVALVSGQTALGSVVYLAATTAFFVGLPLAGVIALVDLVLERRRRRR